MLYLRPRFATVIQAAFRGFRARRCIRFAYVRFRMQSAQVAAHAAAMFVQKRVRGLLVRRRARPTSTAVPQPTSAASSASTRTAASSAKKAAKRKSKQAKAAAARADGLVSKTVGSLATWTTPRAPFAARIVSKLYQFMAPVADFCISQIDALRCAVTERLQMVEASSSWPSFATLTSHPTLHDIVFIYNALEMEHGAAKHHPERHSGGTTALVRFLGAYLKKVVDAGRLVVVRGSVYTAFATTIRDAMCRKLDPFNNQLDHYTDTDNDDALDSALARRLRRFNDESDPESDSDSDSNCPAVGSARVVDARA